MLRVVAVPEILGLQGGCCRWCFQKGFSKKPSKKGLKKSIVPKKAFKTGPSKKLLQKASCKGVG